MNQSVGSVIFKQKCETFTDWLLIVKGFILFFHILIVNKEYGGFGLLVGEKTQKGWARGLKSTLRECAQALVFLILGTTP